MDDWIVDERSWLAAGSAQVRAVNHIVTDTHASAEYVLAMSHEGSDVELPLHLVAELDGDRISALRAYHSTYPLTGEHIIRAPLVSPNPDLEPGAPVDAYEAAMAAGDPEALDALFEPDGYVREPAGPAFKHQGAGRMGFYGAAFSGGPVPLQLCTIIDDGAALAFEYVCEKWGPADLPSQAGSAVYIRSSERTPRRRTHLRRRVAPAGTLRTQPPRARSGQVAKRVSADSSDTSRTAFLFDYE